MKKWRRNEREMICGGKKSINGGEMRSYGEKRRENMEKWRRYEEMWKEKMQKWRNAIWREEEGKYPGMEEK